MENETPAAYTRDGEILDALPADFYSSRSYTDFLMDAVRENRGDGRPFLAYLALTSPHDPMHVPEPWRSKYEGRYDAGYEMLKVERADGAKRAGVMPETAEVAERHPMVRPWDSLGEEDRERERVSMEVYAGMMENADYLSGPGVEGAGRVSGAFSYVWDIMPTILDLAGVQHPAEAGDSSLLPMRGRSMAAVLSGESETVRDAGALIAGEMGSGRWISDGTHKAVLVGHPYGDGTWELYNIAEDPGESRNIAEQKPEMLERFIAAWDEYAAEVGVVFPPGGEEPE